LQLVVSHQQSREGWRGRVRPSAWTETRAFRALSHISDGNSASDLPEPGKPDTGGAVSMIA
jgi:hypothetical protein